MVKCSELTNDVLLDPGTAAVREHLERCSDCRNRRLEIRSIGKDLAELGRGMGSAENPALVREILSRIPARSSPGLLAWTWGAAAAAAAIAALLTSLHLGGSPPSPRPVAGTGSAATPPEPAIRIARVPVPPPAPAPLEPAPQRGSEPVPTLAPANPRPPDPPARTLEIRPTVPPAPERPEPKDARVPAAPTQTQPVKTALLLSRVEGALDLEIGGAWKRLSKSASWDPAVGLRSDDRLAAFSLPEGTRAVLRPHTELRLVSSAPPAVAVEKGEAYFEVIPASGRRFSVTTPDAVIQVTGTQFSVRRTDHTEVVVSAGEVKVGNDRGEVTVAAGNGTVARSGAAPSRPRALDTDRATAWHRELEGPETVLFRYDFEDGRLPMPWTSGRVVRTGPPRGLNSGCLLGTPGIDMDLGRMDKRFPALRPGLRLRFRYWTSGADMIWVQLFCPRVRDNFRFEIKNVAAGRWETVEIPLADFYRLSDGTHPQEGDRFNWFNISASNATNGVYFDDIEFFEIRR